MGPKFCNAFWIDDIENDEEIAGGRKIEGNKHTKHSSQISSFKRVNKIYCECW